MPNGKWSMMQLPASIWYGVTRMADPKPEGRPSLHHGTTGEHLSSKQSSSQEAVTANGTERNGTLRQATRGSWPLIPESCPQIDEIGENLITVLAEVRQAFHDKEPHQHDAPDAQPEAWSGELLKREDLRPEPLTRDL